VKAKGLLISLALVLASRVGTTEPVSLGGPAKEFSLRLRATFEQQDSSIRLSVVSEQETIGVVLSPSSVLLLCPSRSWRRKREVKWELTAGKPVPIVLQCRQSQLAISAEGKTAATFRRKPGKCRVSVEGVQGVVVSGVRFQPYEPIVFADDFMRTDEVTSSVWTAPTGRWRLAKAQQFAFSASPFRLQAVEGNPAWYRAGHGFWRDYLLLASLRITSASASAGLGFYTGADDGGFLFRWNGMRSRFELVRTGSGEEKVLAEEPGGLHERQWYRFSVGVCGTQARCFVDETEVFRLSSDELVEGGVGLYASPSGEAVEFDDVLLRGVPFGPDEFPKLRSETLISWMRSVQPRAEIINETFQQDRFMKNWASAAAGWHREGTKERPVHRQLGRHYGGFELRVPLAELPNGKPIRFRLPGCVLRYEAADEDLAFSLWAQVDLLGAFSIPCADGALAVRWSPEQVEISSGERRLLRVPAPRYAEPVIAIEGEVEDSFWEAVEVRSARKYGYTFYRAPSDWWVTTGKWEAYSRWSCRPEWSFFGGLDDQLALIWNKRRFPGDVCLSAYVANPMVTMRPPFYAETSLNLTICGDGVHPFSGYTLVMGGWNRPVTRLYREDKLVAQSEEAVVPVKSPSLYHREWFHLQLAREGRRIRAFFDGKRAFEFSDPHPLKGDRVGVWALEYGISVGRVQIFHAEESAMWTPLETPGPPRTTNAAGWRALDGEHGANLSEHEEKGIRFVRLTNPEPGGAFAAAAPGCPFDACERSVLRLRYRIRPGVLTNLYLREGEDWHVLQLTGPTTSRRPVNFLGKLAGVKADGRWHSVEFDLLPGLREAYPTEEKIQIEEIRTGVFDASDLHAGGLDGNDAGASWDVAEFAILPARGGHPPQAVDQEAKPFAEDFEQGLGRWERFGGPDGAYLFRDLATRASGAASMQIYKETHGGVFGARWKVTPFHLEECPVLRFDYRMPHQARVGLLLQVGESWLDLMLSPNEKAARRGQLVHAVQRDDQWHRAEVKLLELFRSKFPEAKNLWVKELMFGDQGEASLNGYAGNWWGIRYWLDNVVLIPSGKKTGAKPPERERVRPDGPWASAVYPDRLFLQSFETGPMPWRDWCGGTVVFAPGPVGERCARVFGYRPAAYLSTMIWEDWIDVNRYPVLRFDYRIPPDAAVGFALNLEEFFYLLPFSKPVDLEKLRPGRPNGYVTGLVPGCQADDRWHTIEIDLLAVLRERFPDRKDFFIRDLRTQRMGGSNPLGVSCYFDNVSVHSRSPGKVELVWRTPSGTTAQSFHVDSKPDTIPDEAPEEGGSSASFDLEPGVHYFHLRTRDRDGKWSGTAHVPVRLVKE